MRAVVIMCGDREWDDPIPVRMMVRGLVAQYGYGTLLVAHGNAPGADTHVEHVCQRRNIETWPFDAEWKVHGPSAGPLRNRSMLRSCQELEDSKLVLCVGFHNDIMSKTPRGNKRGTRDMLDIAQKAGVPTYLISSWPRVS